MNGDVRDVLSSYTLDRYETEFADRHLLHGAVAKWAKETPDAIAIVDFDSGRQFTYLEFDRATTALALALLDAGYQPGHFLATMLPLLPEHILLEYACFKIGVVHVPLDLRLKAAEVVRSLELVKARGFAFLGKTPVADFAELGRVVQNRAPHRTLPAVFGARGNHRRGDFVYQFRRRRPSVCRRARFSLAQAFGTGR